MNLQNEKTIKKETLRNSLIIGNYGGISKEKSYNDDMQAGCGCYCKCPDRIDQKNGMAWSAFRSYFPI